MIHDHQHLRNLSEACNQFWEATGSRARRVMRCAVSDTIVFIPEDEWDTFTPEPGVAYSRVRRPTTEEQARYDGNYPHETICDPPRSVVIVPKPRAEMTYEEWYAESVRLIEASQRRGK